MRKYVPVNFTDVTIEGAFWKERLETVLSRTVPSQYRQMEAHGIVNSLTLPKPVPPLRIPLNRHDFSTEIFWDSDVGKWIEAAGYALMHRRDPDIEAKVDHIGELMEQGQLPDGYLNFWYIEREPEKRWTNLRDNHELYCAGHMLEGALAYAQATGKRKILDVMLRYVDHIATVFGPGPGQKKGYCGHQEIELALMKLYRETKDRKHLDLAVYFINQRGNLPHYFDEEAAARGDDPKDFWAKSYEYNQSHTPVRQQKKVVGHAVRAMYMYAAMADIAAETGDDELQETCERLWRDVTSTKLYVTAGLGSSAHNEGFTSDFDLPNDTAYAETCASVALIFWAQRMLHLDLDGKYADVLEQSLFNGSLAGLSRDGENYFYENPLESDGSRRRWVWHPCPCCTMNVSRLVASVGGYFCSTGDNAIAIHLYGGTKISAAVAGRKVVIREQSNYPWSGDIRFEVTPESAQEFAVKLRIPGWANGSKLWVNARPVSVKDNFTAGYVTISRVWQPGDRIRLLLPMPPERIYARPEVRMDAGRVALRRGPLIYCLEQTDNPSQPIPSLRLPRDTPVKAVHRRDLFDGIVVLSANGRAAKSSDWNGEIYRGKPATSVAAKLTAVPYYLWSNREAGAMSVWLPEL